jgi:hypothetical protein
MDHFYLNLSSSSENNNINNISTPTPIPETSNQNMNEEEILYNKFVFDEKYIIQKLKNNKVIEYKTNDMLIEKLCLNLENKILLAKIELVYIELICKNINSLFIDNPPNKENEHSTIKNTLLNLINLLINYTEIQKESLSFEEILVISLEKVLNNLYDDSYFNKQLDNLPNIFEIISEYETNKNLNKGNLIHNMALCIVYLIIILEKFKKENKNKSLFNYLFKKRKYRIKEILEEKDGNNNNRFKILYEQESKKIIIYDDLFLYHFYLTKGEETDVEINDIVLIKNSKENKDNMNNKLIFKINNDIIINFNCDEEGESECKKLEEKYQELKNNISNTFPQEFSRFNLNNLLKYVEEL